MIALEEIDTVDERRQGRAHVQLPEMRPSILDPDLEGEPWIDYCCCSSDKLCLFLHNHPIAIIAGSALECFALNMRLNQLRHRSPRQV